MEAQITHYALAPDGDIGHCNYKKSSEFKEDEVVFISSDSERSLY
jgi:hypothetical protein